MQWVADGWVSISPVWVSGSSVPPVTGGGRRYRIPIIDLAQHDDEIALTLLEAEDGY